MIVNFEKLKEFAAVRLHTKPELLAVNCRAAVLADGDVLKALQGSIFYAVRLITDGQSGVYHIEGAVLPLPFLNPAGGSGGSDLTTMAVRLLDVNGVEYDAPFVEIENP